MRLSPQSNNVRVIWGQRSMVHDTAGQISNCFPRLSSPPHESWTEWRMRGRRKETVSSRALAYMHRLLNHADRRVVGPLIGGTWPSAARQPTLLRVRVRAESLKPDQIPSPPFRLVSLGRGRSG